MEIITQILSTIGFIILGAVGIYLAFRVATYAVAKSWFQAKRNEEIQNGKEEEKKIEQHSQAITEQRTTKTSGKRKA